MGQGEELTTAQHHSTEFVNFSLLFFFLILFFFFSFFFWGGGGGGGGEELGWEMSLFLLTERLVRKEKKCSIFTLPRENEREKKTLQILYITVLPLRVKQILVLQVCSVLPPPPTPPISPQILGVLLYSSLITTLCTFESDNLPAVCANFSFLSVCLLSK